MHTEQLEFDVVVVGAGPGGLSAAIRLAQLGTENGRSLRVCVLEKGSAVGAHILSGAVMDPSALDELLPDWKTHNPPSYTSVERDSLYWLSRNRALPLPMFSALRNRGNIIISLSQYCRWLGEQAESLGVEIYAGFAATECLYDDEGAVCGIKTGDMGVDKTGKPGPNFQPGVEILAKQTIFAEGCRGYLTQQLVERYGLAQDTQPQIYGLGVKEVWEVDPAQHQPGHVMHTVGWPLDHKTYGGSFVYAMHAPSQPPKVAIGLVAALDYTQPSFSPFSALQQLKTHPKIAKLLQGGRRIAYGARALNEGGWQAMVRLNFPGGLIVGCAAGMLNVPRIKGIHNAIRSGSLAAKAVFDLLARGRNQRECRSFTSSIGQSAIARDLMPARNIRPAFKWGLHIGMAYAALDQFILRGRAPWTLRLPPQDHLSLRARAKNLTYPAADNTLTFDRLTDLSFSGTNHEEDQPVHLKVADMKIWHEVNWKQYGAPEQYYCPAGVYEVVEDEQKGQYLQINAPNCLHCKACDIKDPRQNITWAPPQGGGGPHYEEM